MSKISYPTTTVGRSDRKAKKSYTLSAESVEFLEKLRKKRRARSASSVLDDILRALRREETRRRLDRAVADYYNELSFEEREEQRAWGDFALRNFPSEG